MTILTLLLPLLIWPFTQKPPKCPPPNTFNAGVECRTLDQPIRSDVWMGFNTEVKRVWIDGKPVKNWTLKPNPEVGGWTLHLQITKPDSKPMLVVVSK